MRVVSTQEMVEIENITREEFGFDEKLMIENVGTKGAEAIDSILKENDITDARIRLTVTGGDLSLLSRSGSNAHQHPDSRIPVPPPG